MTTEEELVVSKTRDLMRAIDRARRYRLRVAAAVNLTTTILAVGVVCLGLYLLLAYMYYAYGFGPGSGSATILGVLVLAAVGIAWGVVRAEKKVRMARGGDWQADLEEGFPGALKLLTGLDWVSAVNDTRIARVGSVLYGFMRIVAIALLLSVLIAIAAVATDLLLALNLYFKTLLWPYWFIPAVALVLAAAASEGDMKRRFRESSALDSLVWELRVFSTGLARSEFTA